MRRGRFSVLLSLALVVALAAMTGCQPAADTDDEDIGRVTVVGVWGGGEIESFQEVAAGWEDETGGTMEFEGTRDLSSILRARVAGGNPPDLAILPNPALLEEFARNGDLQPLDGALDMSQLEGNFSETWIDQGTVDGQFYGLFVKASSKSTVWYNPSTFEEQGYEIPETWEDLMALTERMAEEGDVPPWSIGIESGGASGWPASDWIQEIVLAESGPEVYDQWVSHEIPWTDPAIRSAFEKFGEIALNDDYVLGGPQRVVSTGFEDASYDPFTDPPQANMYFLGAFAQGFIEGQFPDLEPVQDYDFFDFPPVDPQYQGAATGGADVIVMFNDTPSARSLLEYLAQGESWRPWAEAGGYQTPNQGLSQDAYPDEISAKAAQQLTESQIFRFDADDAMPAEVQNAFWSGILNYLEDPGQLDQILQNIENTAEEVYARIDQPEAEPGEEPTPDAGEEATPGAGAETTPGAEQ